MPQRAQRVFAFAAIDSLRTESGTIVNAYGATWLLTIADSAWRAKGGTEAASARPLPAVIAA